MCWQKWYTYTLPRTIGHWAAWYSMELHDKMAFHQAILCWMTWLIYTRQKTHKDIHTSCGRAIECLLGEFRRKWSCWNFGCRSFSLHSDAHLSFVSIPTWISTCNHMSSKLCSEITYPFPNLNDFTVEVWEWIGTFILHFIMDMITYPCWDYS